MDLFEDDREFLLGLGFVPECPKLESQRWRLFKRSGRVLMVLPEKWLRLKNGIQLYQPQRRAARWMTHIVGTFPGPHFFLPVWSAGIVSEPLATILEGSEISLAGVLLGNPTQAERRAILLLENRVGDYFVLKLGTTAEAIDRIKYEARLLGKLESRFKGVPSVLKNWDQSSSENPWCAFSIPFCKSSQSPSLETQINLLTDWLTGQASDVFRESRAWEVMLARATALGVNEEIENSTRILKLKSALTHGDFTPWNILLDESGDPFVIDWEYGSLEGVPGWDLVHSLVFTSVLVDKAEPVDTIRSVAARLQGNPAIKTYLNASGWGSQVALLLRSYLILMSQELPQFTPWVSEMPSLHE